MLRTLSAGLFICVLLAGLGACGQKGPLYLPVTPPRTIPAMPKTTSHAAPAATTYPVTPAVTAN